MNKIDIAFKDPNEINPYFKHYDTVEDWWNACKVNEVNMSKLPEYTGSTFHQLDIFSLLEQDLMLKKDLNKF